VLIQGCKKNKTNIPSSDDNEEIREQAIIRHLLPKNEYKTLGAMQ